MTDTAEKGVCIITGGASGIGFAIARALLADGWKLLLADRDEKLLDAARADLERDFKNFVRPAVMDVTDEDAVIAAIGGCEAGFGPVRGLVNSAGIGRDVPFFETSAALFRQILDINVVGSFLVAREAAKLMKAQGGGAIVNIASVSGQRGLVGRSAYGASKGGVITLTKVMASELAADGIRVNAIAPGPIETPMVKAMHGPEIRARWLSGVPQRRYAEPHELGGAARFLLDGSMSSFVTGHVLNVDGGFVMAGLLP